MSLIKSISGIRGTIGGRSGEGLGGVDIVRFTAAYAQYIKNVNGGKTGRIVVGRDARISGKMVSHLVVGRTKLPPPFRRKAPAILDLYL